ncbi:MAG: PadR family transcriptional regulator [Thainema sp.]
MALAHTILVVLVNEPCSGYDISKRFDEGVGCFWQASQQQIYRELSKMEDKGWVESEKIPQEGKPDKKIYYVTDTGKQELASWFAEPTEPTPIREDLLVKVLSGAFMPRDLLVKELQYRRQMHLDQLAFYKEKDALFKAETNPSLPEQFRYMTLRRGIRYEMAWIDWCDEVLEFIKTL